MANALLNIDFLRRLDQYRHKTVYARLVSLNFDEDPIAEITGNVVSGSVNVDGSSNIRRTCSLQLITNVVRINEVDWSLRTKFKCYIGIENNIDDSYDKIIWFPQGTFVITSFNSQLNNSGYTISISGKDKMCLLNGDVSGQLFATHEFSTIYTTHRDGTISKEKIPIKQIIKESVHTYAQEPYNNIIINDLDTCGVELIDYTGTGSVLYIFEQRREDTDPWTSQICFSGSLMANIFENEISDKVDWDWYCDVDGIHYHLLKRIDPEVDISTTAGYRATDLTYTEDLVVSVGGNITQMLDNIVKMLGEFEYFYDIDGRFIFQRKRIYFNSAWTNAVTNENETYYDSVYNSSSSVYDFLTGYLVESIQNKPNIGAIRNDYAIWGKRKTNSGMEIPIHLRYAFDVRPHTYYSLLENSLYVSNLAGGTYDWRELIYQMARDNLAATTRIFGLTKAIANEYYHYDYALMDRDQQYLTYYKYNDITKRFETLHQVTEEELVTDYGYADDRERERQLMIERQHPGIHEYQHYKTNKMFLYGPDKNLAQWLLSEIDINNINYDMQFGRRYDENGQPYHVERYYDDYSYGESSYQTEFLSYVYSHLDEVLGLTAEDIDALYADNPEYQALKQYQQDEEELLDHYMSSYVYDDMRREIDAWSDTFNTGYDAYYADMLQFWPQLYRTSNKIEFVYDENGNVEMDETTGQPKYSSSELEFEDYQEWVANGYWNPELIYFDRPTKTIHFKNPELLYFWLDFAEQDDVPALWEYSVPVIGRRSKSINDDQVKAIYFRDTPNLLFISEDYDPVEYEENLAYVRINIVPPISNYFRISAQGKSAKEELDSMIYEGTYYQETITLNTIPIYYLEPNTRITVQDDSTGINGDYLVKSFSIPFAHDGLMSITATCAGERII